MSRLFVAVSLSAVLVLSTIAGCGKSEAEKFNDQATEGLSALAQHRQVPPTVAAEPIRPYIPQEEQAAVAGIDGAPEPLRPVSAIVVLHCRKLMGLGFIDNTGGFHNVPLEGLTKSIIQDLLSQVPAEKIAGYVVPCGHSDGTPI